MREAPEEAQAYRGVTAPTRNSVNETVAITEMPQVHVPWCMSAIFSGDAQTCEPQVLFRSYGITT